MLLRDPVHGLVTFAGREGELIEALLRTRELQRLRRVRQLGLASLVYPGAEHSRFAHALGAAYVMTRLLDHVQTTQGDMPVDVRIDAEARLEAVAAALLHDAGHGPFSHLFEEAMPSARHHEDWTADILRDDTTEVHAALEAHASGMAERVAGMLAGHHRLEYLPRTVSSVFDVDRADYLLRDSHATGVRYGLFDLDWLIGSLRFAEHRGGWVLAIEGRKGLPPIESFFMARYAMYQQVYHHKAVRAAEALVRAIFLRFGELVRAGDEVPGAPVGLVAAAASAPLSLDEYLALDDPALHVALDAFTGAKDPVLARLASAFRARRLPKSVPLPEDDEASWAVAHARAEALALEAGLDPALHVRLDVATDAAYEEPTDDSSDGLFVVRKHRPLARLGDVSFLLHKLRNQRFRRPRLVFDAALAPRILPILDEVLS